MEPSYQQQIHERNQSSAEVDSLKLLWGGTMKQFTREARRFEMWLIGYVETTRNINDVHRQFIRREGMMLPGELIRYMDCLVGPDSDVAAKGCNFTAALVFTSPAFAQSYSILTEECAGRETNRLGHSSYLDFRKVTSDDAGDSSNIEEPF